MMQKSDMPNSSDAVAADIESGLHHLALDNQEQGHPPIYRSNDLEDFGVYLKKLAFRFLASRYSLLERPIRQEVKELFRALRKRSWQRGHSCLKECIRAHKGWREQIEYTIEEADPEATQITIPTLIGEDGTALIPGYTLLCDQAFVDRLGSIYGYDFWASDEEDDGESDCSFDSVNDVNWFAY